MSKNSFKRFSIVPQFILYSPTHSANANVKKLHKQRRAGGGRWKAYKCSIYFNFAALSPSSLGFVTRNRKSNFAFNYSQIKVIQSRTSPLIVVYSAPPRYNRISFQLVVCRPFWLIHANKFIFHTRSRRRFYIHGIFQLSLLSWNLSVSCGNGRWLSETVMWMLLVKGLGWTNVVKVRLTLAFN